MLSMSPLLINLKTKVSLFMINPMKFQMTTQSMYSSSIIRKNFLYLKIIAAIYNSLV